MTAADGPRAIVRAKLATATPGLLEVEVESPTGIATLRYESPEDLWPQRPTTLDFAAIALAQFAASMDADLVIDGPVRSSVLDGLDEFLSIWSVWRPDLFQHVSITAMQIAPEAPPRRREGAVMGFSGGVDASFALAAHSTGTLGRQSRPVDLGVLVIGWDLRHGDVEASDRAAAAAKESLAAFGAELAVVSTNWQQEFCAGWFMSFNAGLMSILHTLSDQFSAAIHATDHDYLDELQMPPYGSHMAINHLLGSPAFPVISTGGTHKRVDRLGLVANHPALLEGLRVCYQEGAGGANCGHCEKCVRTQLELRVLGLEGTAAFASPMTADDLDAATVTNATVLMHFEDILSRMRDDDDLRPQLQRWVHRERLARARRRHLPLARIVELEAELAAARHELSALKKSRSWRMTQPLRAATDRLRALKRPVGSP